MTLDDKVDMIYTGICEMRPIVMATAESIRTMDLRQRFLENRIEKHDVKIERAIIDIDSIGKKARMSDDQSKISATSFTSDDTKWIAVLKFLAVLPHYSKGIITFGLLVISIIAGLFGINISLNNLK